MKNIYFIMSIIMLFAVSFSFDINESKANAQCYNMLDDDGDGKEDFITLLPKIPDPECISVNDNDENFKPPAGTFYYNSFQDPTATFVSVTNCLGVDPAPTCASYNGDLTGCATGWVCPANNTTAGCCTAIVSGTLLPACTVLWPGTNCTTPYAACNCTCLGGPPPGPGCAAPGDGDGDGDPCDYSLGENMFNCPADCLPFGIPSKPIEDAIADAVIWILGFAVAISIVMLIYGGLYYVTSSGDTEKAATSKKIIKYALLGVTIAGASYVIVKLLDTIIG